MVCATTNLVNVCLQAYVHDDLFVMHGTLTLRSLGYELPKSAAACFNLN